MIGRKLKKQFCKGEGERGRGGEGPNQRVGVHICHLTLDWGGGGGPCPLAELDRGSDSAGTPATLTSYLNSDLNFFQNMFTCL